MTDDELIDIYYPGWSTGLANSAAVLQSAIGRLSSGRIKCRLIRLAHTALAEDSRNDPPPATMTRFGRVAIFLERLFSRPFMDRYKSRILVPNPEWLIPSDVDLSHQMIDTILHKTRFSFETLGAMFPGARHHYIGFTSPEPLKTVRNYLDFCHFRGKATTRHTQLLLDVWRKRPDLPTLSAQAYGPDIALRLGTWVGDGNVRLFLDYFASHSQYFVELAQGGLHLCTSATEGFGHYINESRAMSAVIFTLDAAPMNELVAPDYGVLIPTTGSRPLNAGFSFETSADLIEEAIDRVLSLPVTEREAMGRRARQAFEDDRSAFFRQFGEALEAIWS